LPPIRVHYVIGLSMVFYSGRGSSETLAPDEDNPTVQIILRSLAKHTAVASDKPSAGLVVFQKHGGFEFPSRDEVTWSVALQKENQPATRFGSDTLGTRLAVGGIPQGLANQFRDGWCAVGSSLCPSGCAQ